MKGVRCLFTFFIITWKHFASGDVSCDGKVYFIVGMDSSSSLSEMEYVKIRSYTATLTTRFKNKNMIATMVFARDVKVVTDFGNLSTSEIALYPHIAASQTRSDLLIKNMTAKLTDSNLDPNIPKVGLVVTDGRSTSIGSELSNAAFIAASNNVNILALGVSDTQNYSPRELLTMTNGIDDHVMEASFANLSTTVLDQTVEKICLLSQGGSITPEVVSGDFFLSIFLDVTGKNFEKSKEFLKLFLRKIDLSSGNTRLLITVGYAGPIGRFGKDSSKFQIENFISELNSFPVGDFDPILAFQRMENDMKLAMPYSSKVAVFITDKGINNFKEAKTYYESHVKESAVTVIYVGIGSNINIEQLWQLTFGNTLNRIIVSETALLSSGINRITSAVSQAIEKTPIQVYSGPAEVVIAAEYCPAPLESGSKSSIGYYTDFLRSILNHTEIYPGKVELTAITYCDSVRYITSSNNHHVTFHVTHGLHSSGVITRLQLSTSNVMREILNLFENLESDVKIAIVIVADDFMEGDLNALTQEALMKDIIVLPLGIATDNVDAITLKLGSMATEASLLVNISTLYTNGIKATKQFVEEHVGTNGRTDIAVSMSSINLNDTSLQMIKHFVKMLKTVLTTQTTTDIKQNILQDIRREQTAMESMEQTTRGIPDDRNTHLALYEIENELSGFTGNKLALIITNGPPTESEATLAMAEKIKRAGISLFTLAYSVSTDTIQFYRNMSGQNLNILPDSSKAFMAAFSTGKNIIKGISRDAPTHIFIAVDSSLAVTLQDFENIKTSVSNFLILWSKNLDSAKFSLALFGPHIIFIVKNENLNIDQNSVNINTVRSIKHLLYMENTRETQNVNVHKVINELAQRLTSQLHRKDGIGNVIIVLTDRNPTDPVLTDIAIANAEREGIKVITIGVGSDVSRNTIHFNDSFVDGPQNFDKWAETMLSSIPGGRKNVFTAVAADYRTEGQVMSWMKKLTIKLFKRMYVQNDLEHFGLVTFKDHIVDIIRTQEEIKLTDYIMRIRRFKAHGPGKSRTDTAIKEISRVFDFTMSDASKAVVFVTGRGSYSNELTEEATRLASNSGINLISIGIGADVSDKELSITSNNEVERTMRVDEWKRLNDEALEFTVKTLHDIQPRHLLSTTIASTTEKHVHEVTSPATTVPFSSKTDASVDTTTSEQLQAVTASSSSNTESSKTSSDSVKLSTTVVQNHQHSTTTPSGGQQFSSEGQDHHVSTTIINQVNTITANNNDHGHAYESTTVHVHQTGKPVVPVSLRPSYDQELVDDICKGCLIDDVKGFGYVPYKEDCSRYVQCYKDRYYVQNCALDLFWDQDTLSCKPINEVQCQYDPCIDKAEGYKYVTERLSDVDFKLCSKYYKCDGTRKSRLCTCEPTVKKGQLIMQRYDDVTKQCIPDPERECHHHVDGTYDPQEIPYKICYKIPIPGQEDMYTDIQTQTDHRCEEGYTYQQRYCMCVEAISQTDNTYECKPLVDYSFDEDSIPGYALNNMKLVNGIGLFYSSLNSSVTIDVLANNYDPVFGVKITLQRTGRGDMSIMGNCLQDPGSTLSLYLEEDNNIVFVVAELMTDSGMETLSVASDTIADFKMATISLVSNSTHIALWVEDVDGKLDGSDDVQLDSDLNLGCQSHLTLGLGFTGRLYDFKWFKNCLPAELQGVYGSM